MPCTEWDEIDSSGLTGRTTLQWATTQHYQVEPKIWEGVQKQDDDSLMTGTESSNSMIPNCSRSHIIIVGIHDANVAGDFYMFCIISL